MKKLAILIGILAVLGLGSGAGATLYTIDFDDLSCGTNIKPIPTPSGYDIRYDGIQVSSQYSPLATWSIISPLNVPGGITGGTGQVVVGRANSVTDGGWSDLLSEHGNALWNYGNGKVPDGEYNGFTTTITLGQSADKLLFDYVRPSADADINVKLYNGDALVYDSLGTLTAIGGTWNTFNSSEVLAQGITFNKLVLSSDDKLITDNYAVNSVPIPGALFLFAPGLAALVAVRRRKQK